MALVDATGQCVERHLTTSEEGPPTAARLAGTRSVALILVGSGTTSRDAVRALAQAVPETPLEVVPERNTTLEGRALYFRYHPPRGLARLIPRGLLSPPEPVDAYAAEALALRWLKGQKG
jgi:hypothetical protein